MQSLLWRWTILTGIPPRRKWPQLIASSTTQSELWNPTSIRILAVGHVCFNPICFPFTMRCTKQSTVIKSNLNPDTIIMMGHQDSIWGGGERIQSNAYKFPLRRIRPEQYPDLCQGPVSPFTLRILSDKNQFRSISRYLPHVRSHKASTLSEWGWWTDQAWRVPITVQWPQSQERKSATRSYPI